MKKLNAFTIHGTAINSSHELKLDEISIVADANTLELIGFFFINAAKKMKKNELEHLHLQDVTSNFSYDKHVDIIILNKDIVTTTSN